MDSISLKYEEILYEYQNTEPMWMKNFLINADMYVILRIITILSRVYKGHYALHYMY